MTKLDYNKTGDAPETTKADLKIATLGDLREFIRKTSLVSTSERNAIVSSIKRADELIGHSGLDLAADPKLILPRLDKLTPANAGLSKQGFANLKSRVRRAFQLAGNQLAPRRSKQRLSGIWKDLERQLDRRSQRELSRFLRFAQASGWQPDDLADVHVERFTAYLRDDAQIVQWDNVVRATIKAWNRNAASSAEWPQTRLTHPAPKRRSYWRPMSDFPASLGAEVEAFLDSITSPLAFMFRSPVTRNTAKQYRSSITALASALVEIGTPVTDLTSLTVLVQPDHVERALHFHFERHHQRVTSVMLQMTYHAKVISTHWVKADPEQIATLKKLCNRLQHHRGRSRGLTDKNRHLLSHFDEPHRRDQLLLLPETLLKEAQLSRHVDWDASLARCALMIELLLTCALRRENMVTLRLDESIKRLGTGNNARWVIQVTAEKVKNREPLQFELGAETIRILEAYLKDWRPKLCSTPTDWLFPTPRGEAMDLRHAGEDIAKKTHRYLGVRITPHQFRHLSADLYLEENPDGLGTVSHHLGHRDFNTTRTYYARSKQRAASRRYQEHIASQRASATRRKPASRRSPRDPDDTLEDDVELL